MTCIGQLHKFYMLKKKADSGILAKTQLLGKKLFFGLTALRPLMGHAVV
jgi:hypothetical protein